MGPNQTYKLLHSKRNHKKTNQTNKKNQTTYGMGKNSFNNAMDKGFISKIHNSTAKKRNNPIEKWAEEPNKHFSKKRHTDGPQAHENMFNITSY